MEGGAEEETQLKGGGGVEVIASVRAGIGVGGAKAAGGASSSMSVGVEESLKGLVRGG